MVRVRYRLTEAGQFRFLTNPKDVYVGKALEIYGQWSPGEVKFFKHLLKAGDNVIEAGANIGAHTVFLADHVGPEGQVFALEPQRHTFQLLCANLALNSLHNVHAWNIAASDVAGEIRLGIPDPNRVSNFGITNLQEAEDGELTQVITLDQRLDRFPKIALIKGDVEGHERHLVLGARDLIARDRPVLYLENDKPEYSEALLETVLGLGYRVWWHGVRAYERDNPTYTIADIFNGTYSLNIIAIPAERDVKIDGHEVKDPQDYPVLSQDDMRS